MIVLSVDSFVGRKVVEINRNNVKVNIDLQHYIAINNEPELIELYFTIFITIIIPYHIHSCNID